MQVVRFNSFLQRNDLYIGIQGSERRACRFYFLRADGIGAVENLALQVGEVDFVGVGEGDFADAARGEVERRGTTEAAGADDKRMRGAQPLLSFDPYFIEQDVAAVAEELLVVQVAKASGKISSPLRRAWSARPKARGP